MAQYTVQQGKRYRAKIRLGFFEGIASNNTIAEKLKNAGFSDVQVWGSGRDRFADGTWLGDTATSDLPDQVKEVEEVALWT